MVVEEMLAIFFTSLVAPVPITIQSLIENYVAKATSMDVASLLAAPERVDDPPPDTATGRFDGSNAHEEIGTLPNDKRPSPVIASSPSGVVLLPIMSTKS